MHDLAVEKIGDRRQPDVRMRPDIDAARDSRREIRSDPCDRRTRTVPPSGAVPTAARGPLRSRPGRGGAGRSQARSCVPSSFPPVAACTAARDKDNAVGATRNARESRLTRPRGESDMPTELGTGVIAHAIQLAIAPVFLLTGVAGLLNVMAARLARVIDRARHFEDAWPSLDAGARAAAREEIANLERRRRVCSWSINYCTTAALLICLVISALVRRGILRHQSQVADRRAVRRRDGGADRRAHVLSARGVSRDAHDEHRPARGSADGTAGDVAGGIYRIMRTARIGDGDGQSAIRQDAQGAQRNIAGTQVAQGKAAHRPVPDRRGQDRRRYPAPGAADRRAGGFDRATGGGRLCRGSRPGGRAAGRRRGVGR